MDWQHFPAKRNAAIHYVSNHCLIGLAFVGIISENGSRNYRQRFNPRAAGLVFEGSLEKMGTLWGRREKGTGESRIGQKRYSQPPLH